MLDASSDASCDSYETAPECDVSVIAELLLPFPFVLVYAEDGTPWWI